MAQPTSSAVAANAPLTLTDQDVLALTRTRRWVRFVAVTSLVGTGLAFLLLAGVIIGRKTSGLDQLTDGGLWVLTMVGLGLFGNFCLRYAASLRAFENGQPAALIGAFRSLRFIWVLVAVGFGLHAVRHGLTALFRAFGWPLP